MRTVSRVLKTFTKAIKQLDAIAKLEGVAVAGKNLALLRINGEIERHKQELALAVKVAAKIKELIS